MTRLVIQIPCFDEASTVEHTVELLPRQLPRADRIEVLTGLEALSVSAPTSS